MSSVEERLARDIAAVTGGVVMTRAELQEAREALEERIDTRRRARHRSLGIAAAAVVLVAGGVAAYVASDGDPKGVGPAEKGTEERTRTMGDADREFLVGTPATVADLAGVWRLDNAARAYQFSDDLTVRFHDSGKLFSDAASTGTYEVDTENQRVTITTVRSDNAACVGTTTTFWASVPNPGNVRMVVTDVSNESPGCATVGFGQQILEGLSPTQTFGAGFAAELAKEKGWKPLTGTNLEGLFSDGEGRLLELDLDSPGPGGNGSGRYFVVDATNEVVDQGTWSAGDAELVLTSSAESAECKAGDRLVLSGVEQHPDVLTDFRGTVTQNTCGGDWISPAWAAVPSLLTD